MAVIEKVVNVKYYLTKSNLPASDYVINPYVGCTHACMYCYACFMKRFTRHTEEWGTFIDIKNCDKPIDINKLKGKSVFLSSVTDCYNIYEVKHKVTRKILEQLVDADCAIDISTKSSLILRDTDLLKRCKNLRVSMSVNTLDEGFKNDMDNASSIRDRLNALEKLHHQGIYTVLFMSPIFPHITDFRAIIEESRSYINEYWFENLNLRGEYKRKILSYIYDKHPQLRSTYVDIYIKCKKSFWSDLALEIKEYCESNDICYTNFFYHEDLVKSKKSKSAE